jgi:RNA polymerase sigma-70 factor (ECF subfamily)
VNDSSGSTTEITDAQLLQRHLDGDTSAFETLVRRYRKPLYNFLAKFTGDRALAEDVFQEAFLQVHSSAGGFDMSRRLKPWLFTIAANKARDAMRSRSRRQAAPLDATVGGEGESGTYADLMPGNIPPPEEYLSNFEMRRNVQQAVQEMPDKLRVVLELCYFQELPYKDAADILNVPLGTIKSRLHAAVKHFADKWKSMAEGQENE